MIYGKVPPQSPELEAAVLGAMMLESDKRAEVLEIIPHPECFYVDANQRIYRAIRELDEKGIPVDILTVTEALLKAGDLEMVGGAYYITRLTMTVVSSAHVEAHARLVMEKYIKREIIRISGQAIGAGYEDDIDCFELLDQLEKGITAIGLGTTQSGAVNASTLSAEFNAALQQRLDNPGAVTGIPTRFPELNRITQGWQKSDLIIIAARPGIGKTSFACDLSLFAAQSINPRTGKGFGVALFSLEMSRGQLMQRIIAPMSSTPLTTITNGKVKNNQSHLTSVFDASARFAGLNFHIDDTGAIDIQYLRSQARRLVRKQGVEMIVIDYLQLMQAIINKGGNREQEISKISRDLKALAKELDVPIIALSQLNRGIENRKESRVPQLSDLRESGAIEQDANVVMFLTRADDQQVADEVDPALRDLADVHVRKNRMGELGDVPLRYVKSTQQWDEHYISGYDNPRAGISSNIPRGLNDPKINYDEWEP